MHQQQQQQQQQEDHGHDGDRMVTTTTTREEQRILMMMMLPTHANQDSVVATASSSLLSEDLLPPQASQEEVNQEMMMTIGQFPDHDDRSKNYYDPSSFARSSPSSRPDAVDVRHPATTNTNTTSSSRIYHRRRSTVSTFSSFFFHKLLSVLFLLLTLTSTSVNGQLGGEKIFFTTKQMTPNVTHRQNVCERYHLFRNGTIELKDALEGMKLHVLMGNYQGAYFNYDDEFGINPTNPGIAADIMDELARRGKFTWRDTFGVFYDPAGSSYNESWTDLLVWGTDVYDVNVDWWAKNLDRMNLGIAFLKEWYDSSIILITKEEPIVISNKVVFWNWTRPYEPSVWYLTIFTIFLSGICYQIIEYYANDRRNRSYWVWFTENAYLSAINFPQNYEYQPKTFGGRLFGVSISLWALVMTATYTANLASLLVDTRSPPIVVETVEEAAVFGFPICTLEGTNSDTYIRDTYPSAIRITKSTIDGVYDGLHNGDCKFAAETKASWLQLKSIRKHNPTCDLEWVGGDRIVKSVTAGFATRADAGHLCSGLIRDVINLHMEKMITDGFIDDAWNREYKRSQDIDCLVYRPELSAELGGIEIGNYEEGDGQEENADVRYRRLQQGRSLWSSQRENDRNVNRKSSSTKRNRSRQLKAGGKSAAAAATVASSNGDTGFDESEKLTIEQMIGTFAFHWILMGIAIASAISNDLYEKYYPSKEKTQQEDQQLQNGADAGNKKNASDSSDTKESSYYKGTSTVSGSTSGISDFFDKEKGQIISNGDGSSNGTTSKSETALETATLRQEVKELRESQLVVQEFQKEMIEEQRKLQRQIESLSTALMFREQQPPSQK